MSATIDVNVLVHASNEADDLYGPAIELLDRLVRGPGLLHVFWPVLMGALRITTRKGVLAEPVPLHAALDNIEALISMPAVRVHGDGPDAWPHIRAAVAEIGRGGNEVPDAHIVALMRQHGVPVIYTEDRGFRRFDNIEVRRIAAG